ncbi:MAG: methyltransferase domain-containing protein [Candidatus Omnitrophica bacterium]|nr:methyltransferase domain-containing protein [Candidatus Omnitrophota bacterium]
METGCSEEDRMKEDWKFHKAEAYHAKTGDFANRVDREVVSRLIEGKSGRAIDLPCGTGRMTPLLRERFETYSADYSPTMLEFAARDKVFQGARLDAFAMGVNDSSFDLVHSLRLSFHYSDFDRILKEFHRVLKPEGILVFDSLNTGSSRWLLSFPMNWARGRESRRVHFRSRIQLLDLLEDQGFEVEAMEAHYLLPTRVYRSLPAWLCRLLEWMEALVPQNLLVLTFWKVRKIG